MNASRLLNTARRRAGLSQRELARRTGIPQSSISRIETGLVSPTVSTLERLVHECGMGLEVVDRPREDDVDRTLIWENLRLTPSQRARQAVLEWHGIEALRGRARPA